MKFMLGEVINVFRYNFDGQELEIVKYYPRIDSRAIDITRTMYACEEIREHSDSLMQLVISWIAYKNLGLNEGSLVAGICRALEIK